MKLIDSLISLTYTGAYKVSNLSGCSITKSGSMLYYVKSADDMIIYNSQDLESCLRELCKRFPAEFMSDKWYVAQ